MRVLGYCGGHNASEPPCAARPRMKKCAEGLEAGGKVVRRGRLNYAIEGKKQEYFLVWAFRFFCSALCTGSKSFLKGGGLVVIRGDRGCKLLGAISIVI